MPTDELGPFSLGYVVSAGLVDSDSVTSVGSSPPAGSSVVAGSELIGSELVGSEAVVSFSVDMLDSFVSKALLQLVVDVVVVVSTLLVEAVVMLLRLSQLVPKMGVNPGMLPSVVVKICPGVVLVGV